MRTSHLAPPEIHGSGSIFAYCISARRSPGETGQRTVPGGLYAAFDSNPHLMLHPHLVDEGGRFWYAYLHRAALVLGPSGVLTCDAVEPWMTQEPLLTTEAVARCLGISQRTVCLWAEMEELPGIKVGRQWRFRTEEIREWLAATSRLSAGRSAEARRLRQSSL